MTQQPREILSEAELKTALDECAREPIHIPGSIQPHGFLLVIGHDKRIRHASENIRAFLDYDAPSIIGKTIDEIFSAQAVATLLSATTKEALEPMESCVVKIGSRAFDAVSSHSNAGILIEFEPQPESTDYLLDKFYYDRLREFAISVRESKTVADLYHLVTSEVFKLTGIDRVKLYKFDEEWNGAVVAESRKDFMTSYLGLHFPASDIPEQARKLYMKSYLRIIPDISYKPSKIIPSNDPDTNAPVDLSNSVLRSVSPVHIQYLDNMNVRASLSISILQNGKLWGLVACHNNSPLYIPYRIRMIAEIMGHIFSAHLSSMKEIQRGQESQRRQMLLDRLAGAVLHHDSMNELMGSVASLSMDAMKADGLAFKSRGEIYVFGDTPDRAVMTSLFEWIDNQKIQNVIYTDDARHLVKGFEGLEPLEGGFMVARVSQREDEHAIWFRNKIVKEVYWAGNPEKTAENTKAGYRLTPRSSFELWKENVSTKSAQWTDEDIQTVQSIVRTLLEGRRLASDQANQAKSQFVANLSHELRTPMNAIIGLSNILVSSQPLSEKQRMYISTLKGSADTLLGLINDLLDVSKIEANSIELENISFDLPRLLQEVVSMMSVRALEKNLRLKLEVENLQETVFVGDPTRLKQVVTNLLGNAVKFTENGIVFLKVTNGKIIKGEHAVTFDIIDSGIGISEDKIGTIFEKFTQADASISRRFGGTGLGLSITKTLVELMGGTIAVKSIVGEGSTFSFTIPLNVAPSPGKDETKTVVDDSSEMTLPSLPRVLIVEDFEPNILVVASYLDDFGYDYDIARNGQDALDMVRAGNYFAVLMDVQMPGMNGLEATETIRRWEKDTHRAPHYIVGVTAHALAGDRERCYGAGMDDYLPKPFGPKELKNKLLAAVFHDRDKFKI